MKKDNKGFSLVELIVVVAIMAVLMTVLAPQLLRYVERSRLQKDNSAIAEIANAVKIAMANEAINTAVADGTTITLDNEADADATISFVATADDPATPEDETSPADVTVEALAEELAAVIGDTFTTTSNTYNESSTDIVLTIHKSGTNISVEATGGWIENVGADPDTRTF